MKDFVSSEERMRVLERRSGSRVLLWGAVVLLVLLFVMFLPSRDARGASRKPILCPKVSHARGVDGNGRAFSQWSVRDCPMLEFRVFYLGRDQWWRP